MISHHLRTFLWLRWRLRLNQLKRGAIANIVILAILGALAVLVSLFMFVAFFLAGWLLMGKAAPMVIMFVWDGLVLAFLFFSAIGLMTDLQRAEALSLQKFLHLPVSLSSAFLINYVSSLVNLSMIFFVPAMVGLILGLALSRGPVWLCLFPLVFALLLAITALIYQFQGWLASLMANKRRRQTIIALVTMTIILACQLPNLINIVRPWRGLDQGKASVALEQNKLKQALQAGEITPQQFQEQNTRLSQDQANRNIAFREQVEEIARIINLVAPPGWLALGAMGLAEGNVLPALLGTLGLGLIGAVSLRRAYRTTLAYYTGAFTSGKTVSVAAAPSKVPAPASAAFLEWKVPGISEHAAAIALACFRSLLRAPEAKMLLMSPIILLVVFGSLIFSRGADLPVNLRPLFPAAALALILLSLVSLAGNQFGFDRNGFRVYVLCPAPRQDILLGKNLAVVPIALILALVPSVLLVIIFPMRFNYLLAVPFQWLAMLFIFLALSNLLSIFAPMAIAAGSMRPTQAKGLPMLLQLVFVFLFPLALSVTLLPWLIELLLNKQGILEGWPICLVLTLLECGVLGFLYRLVLGWQGNLLQGREVKILNRVSVKAE